MFAATAATRPAILVRRPADVASAVPGAPSRYLVAPRAPWSRHHLSFRGTRIFTALMLGWVGLILIAFGAFAVPAATAGGRGEADSGLLSLVGSIAPALWGFGIVHLVAGLGIVRDRASWGFGLATWLLVVGVLIITAGAVLTVAGRDAFALVAPTTASAGTGIELLAWTLALYGLVGWGVRRIVVARELA
jgi:hypothetical protein